MLSTKLIVVVLSKGSLIFANGVVGFVYTYDKLSPVTEVSLTVTNPGAHN